ncbi:MAG: DJ-1/PfpI family protein [Oligoflexia bacterium]|nr:DJ-1/PfpI family protein [Oligoflexia bacterium]
MNKKILMIIAPQMFREEEYQRPREIFEKAGAKITVASSSKKISIGKFGMKVTPDILLDEVKVVNYDAIVFIGGPGATEYFESERAMEIANESVKQNKILAAICIAPSILARAGVLKNKKATVYSSEIDTLKTKGAFYTGKEVEQDGKIITANGPSSAFEFGKAILNAMASKGL